ncbi:MAG: hypothetical protein ACOYEN_06985, partial [Limnochordia bacterium]
AKPRITITRITLVALRILEKTMALPPLRYSVISVPVAKCTILLNCTVLARTLSIYMDSWIPSSKACPTRLCPAKL